MHACQSHGTLAQAACLFAHTPEHEPQPQRGRQAVLVLCGYLQQVCPIPSKPDVLGQLLHQLG